MERDLEQSSRPSAICLLGNAIGQTSKICRKGVLRTCNPNIQDLTEEEKLFADALPNLFGSEFEKKMKERAESVKILAKSQIPSSQSGSLVFHGGHHSQAQRGGGPSFRGKETTTQWATIETTLRSKTGEAIKDSTNSGTHSNLSLKNCVNYVSLQQRMSQIWASRRPHQSYRM